MIVSKYFRIDGKDYVEAADYDKILYELKRANDRIARDIVDRKELDIFNFTEHDKKLADRIEKLQEENRSLRKAYERHRRKICELESELSVKENLLKIKSSVHNEMPIDELSYEEVSESYTFDELVSLCCKQSGEIRRLEEARSKWVSDRIQVNRLRAALNEIAEKCLTARGKEGID